MSKLLFLFDLIVERNLLIEAMKILFNILFASKNPTPNNENII